MIIKSEYMNEIASCLFVYFFAKFRAKKKKRYFLEWMVFIQEEKYSYVLLYMNDLETKKKVLKWWFKDYWQLLIYYNDYLIKQLYNLTFSFVWKDWIKTSIIINMWPWLNIISWCDTSFQLTYENMIIISLSL